MPWNVIGHEWAVDMLRRDLAHDRVRHAYLFTGPAGIGKRTLAGEFSRALLCEAADPPCGRCRHCLLSARGSHADLLTVEPTVSGKSVRTAHLPTVGSHASRALPRCTRSCSRGRVHALIVDQ